MLRAKWSKHLLLPLVAFMPMSASAVGRMPDCSGQDRYPASMTLGKLLNAGLVSRATIDFKHIESRLILSQAISRSHYRQLFRVAVPRHGAPTLMTLTISDSTLEECSISEPRVFVVAREL